MKPDNLSVLCRIRPKHSETASIIPCQNLRGVLASKTPLNKRLYGSVIDSKTIQTAENSEFLPFEGIIPENSKQSQIFDDFVEGSILDMLSGKSFLCLAMGTSKAGKSFTMRGGEGKRRGILLRSVEKLMSILLI